MDIVAATKSYQRWMAKALARNGLAPLGEDLARKHRKMAKKSFAFLRGTYYRWAQRWPELCPGLAKGPRVLAVGDLHLENFGTWRDAEGRLCWGVNDFDEAWPLAYANDLVRLAASALLAIGDGECTGKPARATAAILAGYATALKGRTRPFVLEEDHAALRAIAYRAENEPQAWWADFGEDLFAKRPPEALRALLVADWPRAEVADLGFFYRSAGLGGLGRPRFVARALWRGALAAREAKALVPSAAAWAEGKPGPSLLAAAIAAARGGVDPFLRASGHWVIRRLGPRSDKFKIASLAEGDLAALLHAMGGEIANIHRASAKAVPGIQRDLARRRAGWLHAAAETMAEAMRADWKAWKKHMAGESG